MLLRKIYGTIFCIIYELATQSQDLNTYSALKQYLFGGVKLAKNADPGKHVYSDYGIGFDSHSNISLGNGSVG